MKVIALLLVFVAASWILPAILLRRTSGQERKKQITDTVIYSAAAGIAMAIWLLAMTLISDCAKQPSVLSMAVIGFLTSFGFLCRRRFSSEALRRFAKSAALIAVVLFAAEFLLFNFKSLRMEEGFVITPNYQLAELENPERVEQTAQGFLFKDETSIILPVNFPDVRAVTVKLQGVDESVVCKLEFIDDCFSRRYIEAGRKYMTSNEGVGEFTIQTYGTLQKVRITVSNINSDVLLTSCSFRSELPLRFSDLRFLFLCSVAVLFAAVMIFKWYRCVYDRSSRIHRGCVAALVILCTLFPLMFLDTDAKLIDHEALNIRYTDPYVQMFDAFQDGRTWLDIQVDPAFEALEDKYDQSVRLDEGISWPWDRAYYNGKYYSYFGTAPVFVFYYPVYWLTGKLPAITHTSVFFGMLASLGLCGTILAFAKRFLKKVNLLSLLACLAAAVGCSGTYYLSTSTSFYCCAGLAGSAFLFFCIWAGIEAYGSQNPKCRYPLFVLSGIALALCAASRPTRAVSALLLTPLFLAILLRKENSLKTKLCSAGAFLLPVLAGGIGLMAYNYVRFDSPLEFGAVYQLTVSDVEANTLYPTAIPFAILHYFFQLPNMTQVFPYFAPSKVLHAGYGKYIYSDASHGALFYPLILVGMIVLPFLLYATRRRKDTPRSLENPRLLRCSYYIMAVIALLVAWIDFCVAGVIYSYVADILPILTLLAVWVLLDAQERISDHQGAADISAGVITLAAAATMILCFLEILSLPVVGIYSSVPEFAYAMEDIIAFWH